MKRAAALFVSGNAIVLLVSLSPVFYLGIACSFLMDAVLAKTPR
jgi:hypothetical protein